MDFCVRKSEKQTLASYIATYVRMRWLNYVGLIFLSLPEGPAFYGVQVLHQINEGSLRSSHQYAMLVCSQLRFTTRVFPTRILSELAQAAAGTEGCLPGLSQDNLSFVPR